MHPLLEAAFDILLETEEEELREWLGDEEFDDLVARADATIKRAFEEHAHHGNLHRRLLSR